MLQAAHDLFHGHASFEKDMAGREQDEASQQAQDQMSVIGILPMDLAGFRRQQMRERAEGMFHPTAPLPGPDQAGSCAGRRLTEQVVARLPRFLHDAQGDRPVRGAGGGEPRIPPPGQLQTVSPGPVGPGQPLLACDPAPRGQMEDDG